MRKAYIVSLSAEQVSALHAAALKVHHDIDGADVDLKSAIGELWKASREFDEEGREAVAKSLVTLTETLIAQGKLSKAMRGLVSQIVGESASGARASS